MKKYYFLIIVALILGLALTGCSLLSNISQVPATEQSGINYLTRALPLHDNLVGLWHFSGNALDTSGKGNDGTVFGATYVDNPPMGQALSFNGSTDYVSIGNIGVTGDWTVEFWANLASTNKIIYYPISLSPASSAYGSGIFLAYKDDKWGVYDGVNIVWGSSAVSINTWNHFAVTKSGTTYTLYRNGTYEGVGSLADINISDLNIGRRSDKYWYFEGTIDEVRIWNVALSKSQLCFFYDWTDFLPPVDSGVLNFVKAGRAIPVKFSLNGDQGLDIFEDVCPKSIRIKCPEGDDINPEELLPTVAAGKSSLSYDATTDQYVYVWKTLKAWAGTCRKLVVLLNDGTSHEADFTFK